MMHSTLKRLLWSGSVAGLVSAYLLTVAASSWAASSTVAWQISQQTFPTNLVPGSIGSSSVGPKYEIFVTNVGGAPSPDATVTAELPAGVSLEEKATIKTAREGAAVGSCAANGAIVICELGSAVAPAESLVVTVPLSVSGTSPSKIADRVTIEGGGAVASSNLETDVTTITPPFELLGVPGVSLTASDNEGNSPAAGSHPFVTTVNLGVTKVGRGQPTQAIRTISTELPPGFVVDPAATSQRCRMSELALAPAHVPSVSCPAASQVGDAYLVDEGFLAHGVTAIYNMVPPPGVPAELAFELASTVVVVRGGLSGRFQLTAQSSEIISRFNVSEVALTLWGDPADPRHDGLREGGAEEPGGCLGQYRGCSAIPTGIAFLTMPTSCEGPFDFSTDVTSWLGGQASGSVALADRQFDPTRIEGCGELAYSPTISSKATTASAESPSGLDFGIHQPQGQSPEGRSTAPLKSAMVSLPEGMTLNPSAANGLGVCSEEQMGYAPEEGKIRFRTTPQSCPNSAKVGTLQVHTPLLESVQPGSIYVAKPFDNPFGSLLAIYLAVEDEETGIIAKLAGEVEPDPRTGRLTATFAENPELPIEDINLHFFAGERGVLTTPLICGSQTTTSTLTPWSTPEGADAHPSDSFQISAACSSSEAAAPRSTSMIAGTLTPLAGAYSPFILRISRPDGSQHITGIDTMLPAGLLGKLTGVSYCPESGISQAISRERPEQGRLEQQIPSCPASSEVGTVQVTAGSGSSPIPVAGHAYLAGPYKGAPLSLVVIVPAVAGPFDLGTVVDRVALTVGEYDARIHAAADSLPTIRDGIPLDVRSIELKLDRPSFTLNPTNCEAMQVEASVLTQSGQTQPISNRFQVGECGRLGFRPTLRISLKGATRRTGHPTLKAVLTFPKKGAYANVARAQVNLPHSEFLDQGSIAQACTRVLLAQRACPTKSIYGRARAWTPLLERPVEGPVYLVGGYGYKLPALVAELDGQIRVLLVGKVDTGKNNGIRNTFEEVPDAPVDRFVLELKGGKRYGLLGNSENVCNRPQKAGAVFRAQNGRVKSFSVRIANSCASPSKRRGSGREKNR